MTQLFVNICYGVTISKVLHYNGLGFLNSVTISGETDIRLSLASHSYIYPLGIAEDVLVEVAEHVYPVDFMILGIKEDEKRPFILGTPFVTTAKAVIKFNKGTITLISRKSKISFHRIPESLYKVKRGIKNDIEPIDPTMTVNRLVLEWEEMIKLHLEREMEFDQMEEQKFQTKRHAFWSLNEDILKITILKTNTPYPSRKIRRIRACTHQGPQRNKDQYAVSRGLNAPYSRRYQTWSLLQETPIRHKDRYNTDIRATNILLQGLPKDIYSLINHYTDAKDIWDNVKMLLEGSELTKEDRESQLYDDFEHFRQHKGETIHDYYVRFAKLINDMRNIKMTMSRMQLNSKFVNNMLPEWGRFVTAVKLNRGLRDSNYDQLYAYLKQHEAHANENKMMLDLFTQHTVDPLALMSNVAPQQYNSQSSTNLSSTYVPPYFADNSQLNSGLSPTDNLIENLTNILALLTQSYKTYLPQINNQLRTSSNPRNQATVQLVMGELRTESGMLIQVKQGRLSATTAMENRVALDEEQLPFLAGVDEDMDEQPVQDLALNVDNVFQADKCDAFDSDVDEAPTTQTMFMANLSSADPVYDEAGPSYDSDILSKNTVVDNSLTAKLATYKEQVELYKRRARFELMKREQKIDEQLRIVITDRNIKEENLKKELHYVKLQLASTINHNKSMVEEVTSLKKDFK
ncbi:retrovirus-related pol polyprotein from transposon TNT 1-94 [Tanacetum coccineum]